MEQVPTAPYATALAEMIRQPGLSVDEVFARTRLRTHEATDGLQIPWHSANLGNAPFVFFEQAETAAAPRVREVRRIEEVPPRRPMPSPSSATRSRIIRPSCAATPIIASPAA